VEAKEGVPIQRENQTLATITFQNLFRMYTKLAGMTGTADTEAYEFQSVYGLEVVVIPTHKPMIRKDNADLVFLGAESKFKAVVQDIKDCHERGQPVLVGTASIDVSELVSGLLKKEGVRHEVLNAKQHEREAHIVAQAGAPGSVTIATNMAGRGTDIVLGGSLEADFAALGEDATDAQKAKVREEWQKRHAAVIEAGGLHIVGTERHESRRIDNQLRGRSGRQGDPGSSRFYLSLHDNLMRIFGGERIERWMRMFGMTDDQPLEDRMITRQIEKVQRKVEQHNFDIRKNLLEFDDVANDQRKVIYAQRDELMESTDVSDTIKDIRDDVVAAVARRFVPAESIDEQWDLAGLDRELENEFGLKFDVKGWVEHQASDVDDHAIVAYVRDETANYFINKEAEVGPEVMRQLEKHIMLSVVDNAWKEHLASMDYLRQGIYLRGYAQKQPKQEFKRESFELFSTMLDRIKLEVIQMLARVRVRSEEEVAAMEAEQLRIAQAKQMQFQHADAGAMGQQEPEAAALPRMASPMASADAGPKVGRNDPCPCGSGKKYKHCHGQLS